MSRESILKAVRAANMNRPAVTPGHTRLAPRAYPQLAQSSLEFAKKAEANGIVIERVCDLDAVPHAIVKHLNLAGMEPNIRHGSDPTFAAIPWNNTPELECRLGPATGDDRASLSRAMYGVCETGTLVLASGADNPVTLAFLPDHHIVLLNETDIVPTLDAALAGFSAPPGALPRTINLISGASRTGDIGGQLVMGAHGPRQLIVVLISS